ncbi:hypothetical protein CspeluHIS016_0112020 [Cutaneotrichosporon spelunceum]|uniref:Bud22 domain-containing protein n=1 Tax=Cutaneotrichosporon spelunceum TaxID=1672016 RepID=A0AAD3TQE9_9TREE|nr:hypothetical protein CspeluHIS016_0112020 [Cutaneotrichosporon spelunceum]
MAETDPKPDVQQKKRKRTGKEREERKRAAIQAKLEAEAAAAAGAVGAQEPVAPESEEELAKNVEEEEGGETVDFEKIAQRIPAGLKKLHPVFKQAKKAETMRLIKKIRFLKSKSEDAAELEAQLNLLSAVQLHSLATTHLRQKLKKHHKLKHVALPPSIVEVLPLNPSVASSSSSATPDVIAKVENRLCSSKQVADAIKPVMLWVLCEPGATLKVTKGKEVKTKTKRPKAESESADESENEGFVAGPVEGLDSDDEVVVEDRAADAAGWESGSVGGESDGEDSDSDSEGGIAIAPPSDDGSEPEAPPRKKARAPEPKPASRKEKQGKADGSSSMFLPSLAEGFAAGDGDSDPDMDYDEDGIIGSKKAVRKNRRGQRARQAIWEKKYGKGAKHVVKAREEAEKKMRGPQGQRRDQGWGQRVVEPEPSAAAKPAPRAAAPKPQAEALHPSWEAARLRKQRAVAPDAPKATKIVFD